MRKCGGSERMKKFGLLGIYRTGSWIQTKSIDEPGQELTLIKKGTKSRDFERISRLCDLDRILHVFGILLWI